MKNQPKLPEQDRVVDPASGCSRPHCHGSNSCESDGTMITKRSNHIPRLMKIERMNSQVGLRRSFCEKSDSGRIMLQVSMIHAAHHHCPNTRFQKYSCSNLLPLIPRDPELGQVGEADDHRREQAELRRRVEVVDRDVVLELEVLPDRDDDREHHPDAGEDRAGDEVGREDRRVPARRERHREVERHDRVHREHQRRANAARNRYVAREVAPLAIRVPPAERQHREDRACAPGSSRGRAAPRCRESARRRGTSLETVRYVRIANTSHTSGLLKFGQMSRQFGYGISQKNFHGRPRWRSGRVRPS